MKAAVVALACVLRFAVSAQAGEVARPQPVAQQSSPAEPPPALRPWVDPATAHPVGQIQPPASAVEHAAAPSREEPRRRQCLSAVETRQTIAAHRLTEPFRALRAGGAQGEALRAKLCRWKQDQFVYEVFVLRHDGRIVRLYMNAQNGQAVGSLDDDRH